MASEEMVNLLVGFLKPIVKAAVREALDEQARDDGPEPLWKRPEAAKFLGCSLVKLDQMVTAGQVPSKLIGGSRRFDPVALRGWVRAGQ